jgi:hypothetical protein
MKTVTRYLACSLVWGGVLLGAQTKAHDLDAAAAGSTWAPARAAYLPGSHPIVRPPNLVLPEFVVSLPHRWSIGQQLRVCFVGGSTQLRASILGIAAEWFRHANLTLLGGGPNGVDCEQDSRFEIRIGFNEPGLWSYVGTESLNVQLTSQNLTSMNFEGFDAKPQQEPRFSGVILHEFGHALGFEHEHQSPASGCDDEYDWPKLYAYYKSAYNWDKTKVDHNVRQLLNDHSAYGWSQFNPSSIMIYSSNPAFLKKGIASVCYLHENNTLSALDVEGAKVTYPAGADANELLRARAGLLSKHVTRLPAGTLRDALKQQLKLSNEQLKK